MDTLLKNLLNALSAIGITHKEIFDTECRNRMGDAILDGFIRRLPAFVLDNDFGLFSTDSNEAVREALLTFINDANNHTQINNIYNVKQGLNLFQNEDINSDNNDYYDAFFGYIKPKEFDDSDMVVYPD